MMQLKTLRVKQTLLEDMIFVLLFNQLFFSKNGNFSFQNIQNLILKLNFSIAYHFLTVGVRTVVLVNI
jgi:hypothetical protein